MRSPCRFSRWRRDALAIVVLGAAMSCGSDRIISTAADSRETEMAPARDPGGPYWPRPEPPYPEPVPTLTIALYDSPQPNTPNPTQTTFSIASTRELYAYSIWSGLEGEHFETRRFYTPSDDLYYQELIPFSTESDEPYPFTQRVAIPHALTVQPVTPNERGEVVIRDYLAVAGAPIGDRQITGTWRLEVSLDGEKTPFLAHNFELVP
jgi:hypothetical protein